MEFGDQKPTISLRLFNRSDQLLDPLMRIAWLDSGGEIIVSRFSVNGTLNLRT